MVLFIKYFVKNRLITRKTICTVFGTSKMNVINTGIDRDITDDLAQVQTLTYGYIDY